MDLQLTGLKAVVTGGSAGIGAAIVRVLAAEGCDVAFCARNPARIDAMLRSVEGLPGAVTANALDVADRDRFAAWLATLGGFDIFVPNVSALSGQWEAALATDIRATVDATEAAVPVLQRSQHAAITYIGSKAGSLAAPSGAAYGAAKAAMAHYMKSLATRLLPAVRVNTVSPGDTLFPGGLWDEVRLNDPANSARCWRATRCSAWPRPTKWHAWWPSSPARPPASWPGPTGTWMEARSATCRSESSLQSPHLAARMAPRGPRAPLTRGGRAPDQEGPCPFSSPSSTHGPRSSAPARRPCMAWWKT
jgi:3-oxoacyl-[acyl-carrier protein] reductase